MRLIPSRYIVFLAGLILAFSSLIILINDEIYRFPGNDFFPEHMTLIIILLVLINIGLNLCFIKNSKTCHAGLELLYLFGVMAVIALMTNAIQLTPFPTVDKQIVILETHLHINTQAILIWINSYPQFKKVLSIIYDSLPYQMSILPLLVIATCRFHLIREYYFFLLCTTLLGFIFYYFFPTTAPASIINSPLFSTEQVATGLKFKQIHHYIIPTTNAGGLIALPSFHAIWAVLCVVLIREWIVLCAILAIINTFLIASCILLGWHYCTDICGSIIVLLINYYWFNYCRNGSLDSTN